METVQWIAMAGLAMNGIAIFAVILYVFRHGGSSPDRGESYSEYNEIPKQPAAKTSDVLAYEEKEPAWEVEAEPDWKREPDVEEEEVEENPFSSFFSSVETEYQRRESVAAPETKRGEDRESERAPMWEWEEETIGGIEEEREEKEKASETNEDAWIYPQSEPVLPKREMFEEVDLDRLPEMEDREEEKEDMWQTGFGLDSHSGPTASDAKEEAEEDLEESIQRRLERLTSRFDL